MLMKASKLIEQLNKALTVNTVYASGGFGASIGNYPNQLKRYYDNTLNKCGKTYADKVYEAGCNPPAWAFDCCGLIKGILWGWDAVPDSTYGGALYKSNDVPDSSANSMITACSDVSTDFTNIIPGELLWIDGHVGVYIGEGYAIECTTAWTDKVQRTVVTNIKKAGSGENGRKWTKHGRMPWVEYEKVLEIVCPCCGARFVKI